jgi:hypothetical protein
MHRTNMRRITQARIWCTVAAILVASIPAWGQESKSSWMLVREQAGANEVSARSEIAMPQRAGFATLKITYRAGGNPAMIAYLIVESPRRLPSFPFEKYDGPIDKTRNEFMTFEVGAGDKGKTRSMKVMPSGFYSVTPPDAFVFDTMDKGVASLLLEVKDGQKLTITVNGPPSSIQVVFDTTGLKQLFDQLGLKAVPRQKAISRNM